MPFSSALQFSLQLLHDPYDHLILSPGRQITELVKVLVHIVEMLFVQLVRLSMLS